MIDILCRLIWRKFCVWLAQSFNQQLQRCETSQSTQLVWHI